MSTFTSLTIGRGPNAMSKPLTGIHISETGRRIQVATGTNGVVGWQAVATGGSTVISNALVRTGSIIPLTPMLNSGVHAFASEHWSVRVSGVSFKVNLRKSAATAATGRVAFMIIN